MGIFENSEKAWSIYTRQLEKIVGDPEGAVGFQVARVLRPVEFLTGHEELDAFHKLAIADALPNWHPTYSESAGARVSEGYFRFLLELNEKVIDTIPQADQDELDDLLQESNDARAELTDFIKKIDEEWNSYKQANPGAFRDDWEYHNAYDTQEQGLRNTLDDKLGRYLAKANIAPEVIRVARAWGFLNAPNAQLRLPEDESVIGDKDSWTRFYKTFIDGSFENFLENEVVQKISFGEGSESSTRFESGWNGSASVGYLFFSVSASASGGTISEHVNMSTTSVEFGFKNLAQFGVRRSTWFDGTLLREFANRVDMQKFWGPHGVLSLIPTSIICGRGLTMKINMTNTVRDEFHSWYQASGGAGFNFGPWSIGGSGGSSSRRDQVTVAKDEGAITIEDHSNSIFLIAVSTERPGFYGSSEGHLKSLQELYSQAVDLENKQELRDKKSYRSLGGVSSGGG